MKPSPYLWHPVPHVESLKTPDRNHPGHRTYGHGNAVSRRGTDIATPSKTERPKTTSSISRRDKEKERSKDQPDKYKARDSVSGKHPSQIPNMWSRHKVHCVQQDVPETNYNEHVISVINSSPFPTYSKSLRYTITPDEGKETKTVSRGTQAGAKVYSKVVQCVPPTTNAQIQTSDLNWGSNKNDSKAAAAIDGEESRTTTEVTQLTRYDPNDDGLRTMHHDSEEVTNCKNIDLKKEIVPIDEFYDKAMDSDEAAAGPDLAAKQAHLDDVVHQLLQSIKTVESLLRDVDAKTDEVKGKEDTVLKAIEQVSNQKLSLPDPHVEDDLLKKIPEQIQDILAYLQKKFGSEHETPNVVAFLEDLLKDVRKGIDRLRRDLPGELNSLNRTGDGSIQPPQIGNQDLHKLTNYIEDLHGSISHGQEALSEDLKQIRVGHDAIRRDICNIKVRDSSNDESLQRQTLNTVKTVYELLQNQQQDTARAKHVSQINTPSPLHISEGPCRCEELWQGPFGRQEKRRHRLPSVDLCRKCFNDYRGRLFMHLYSLPPSSNLTLARTLGRVVGCLETDDDSYLASMLQDLDQVRGWHQSDRQRCFEGLLQTSINWANSKCPLVILNSMNIPNVLYKIYKGEHVGSLPIIPKDSLDLIVQLLSLVAPSERNELSRAPLSSDLLFLSAQQGNLAAFTCLVTMKTPLDERKFGRTILHELVHVSRGNVSTAGTPGGDKVVLAMIKVVHENAGFWWASLKDTGEKEECLLHSSSSSSRVLPRCQSLEEVAVPGSTGEFQTTAMRYLMSLTDDIGRTPIQYAVDCGSPSVIKLMISSPPYFFVPEPLEFHNYASMDGFVVTDIDDIVAGTGGLVHRVVSRIPAEAAEVIRIEPFRSLISDRWRRYRVLCWLWFTAYICYMSIYTACVVHRPIGTFRVAEMYQDGTDRLRLAGEVLVLVGILFFFYGEICDVTRIGWVWPRLTTYHGFIRIINILFVTFTLTAIGLRFTYNKNEDTALSVALLLGWMKTLHFFSLWKRNSWVPITLHDILVRDVLGRFMWIFIISLVATSSAVFCAYQGAEQHLDPTGGGSFWVSPYLIFRLTFGLADTDHVDHSRATGMGYVLFFCHMCVINIFLLNIFIAMVVYSVWERRKDEESDYFWAQAYFVSLLDRRLPSCMRVRYERKRGCSPDIIRSRVQYRIRVSLRKNKYQDVVEEFEPVALVPRDKH